MPPLLPRCPPLLYPRGWLLPQVSLDFFITLMTAAIDLVSFSGILYSIYPELFYAIFLCAATSSPPHATTASPPPRHPLPLLGIFM